MARSNACDELRNELTHAASSVRHITAAGNTDICGGTLGEELTWGLSEDWSKGLDSSWPSTYCTRGNDLDAAIVRQSNKDQKQRVDEDVAQCVCRAGFFKV